METMANLLRLKHWVSQCMLCDSKAAHKKVQAELDHLPDAAEVEASVSNIPEDRPVTDDED